MNRVLPSAETSTELARGESGGLDRSQGKQRGMLMHGSIATNQHDSTGTLCFNGNFVDAVQIVHVAENLTFAHALGQGHGRDKQSIDRCRVMDLQVGLIGVASGAGALGPEGPSGGLQAPNFVQQVFDPPVQRFEVIGVDAASALALGVDGGNVAGIGGTQGATRQKWSRPAPVVVETSGHCFLRPCDGSGSGEVSRPRHKRVVGPSAVQVDVVGGLTEHLGVEKMSESGGDFAARLAREGAGEVATVDGMTPLSGVEGGFIEHGNHDDGTVQTFGAPSFHPLPQDRGAFIFVPMGGRIDQQHGPRSASPDPSVEPHLFNLHPSLVKARGEGSDIQS